MKDIIIAAISVVLAVIIIFAFINESSRGKDLQMINSDLEMTTGAFRQEKLALQDELKELQTQKQEKEKGIGSLMLLFTEIDEAFTDEIVPMLDEAGYAATLCLEDSVFDFVSNSYVRDLIAKGWETSLLWDGSEDFDLWYTNVSGVIEAEGLEIPQTVCLDLDVYDDSVDDALCLRGFKTVVINVGVNRSYIDNDDNRLNKINAHPWYTTTAATCLSSSEIYNSQLAFLVGVDGTEMAYDNRQFSLMLNSAAAKISDEKLIITTPKGSLEQIAKNDEAIKKTIAEYEARIKEIEDAIGELDKRIDAVYSDHN